MGLEWVQWVNVILSGGTFLLCLLFVPETLFDRQTALERSGGRTNSATGTNEKSEITQLEVTTPTAFKPYTFARSLSIGTYRPGLWGKVVALFVPLLLPGVWLVSFWYAGLIGGIVTISTIGPTFLAQPPYLWGKNAGLINVGGIIGTILGVFYTYLVVDWTTKRAARYNSQGYSEPESRLWTALPCLFIATTGLWTFGFSAQNPGPKVWLGMEFGTGMLAFGLMQAPSVGFNYVSAKIRTRGSEARSLTSF